MMEVASGGEERVEEMGEEEREEREIKEASGDERILAGKLS